MLRMKEEVRKNKQVLVSYFEVNLYELILIAYTLPERNDWKVYYQKKYKFNKNTFNTVSLFF